MNTPPPLSVGHTRNLITDQVEYEMKGWEDFDRWACCNDTMWHSMSNRVEAMGLDELTRLRLIAAELLMESVKLYEAMERQKKPVQIVVPKDPNT